MPASPPVEFCTLSNGLRVSLRSAAHLKRCAATLQVAAGSHDAAPACPGLAHFLEHLFFLGTERFPAEDGLMRFVQRHGGQLNASTRERTTWYFFEVPVAAFAGGLERLSDMLTRPRLALDDQRREREVLHAEFLAWARDATAQRQFALYQYLSPVHPLRGFHAGNRYTLAVPSANFQQALRDFYTGFYQAGQMTLSIAGPQSIAELQRLAQAFGRQLTKGTHVAQSVPPPLREKGPEPYCLQQGRQLHWLLPVESLPGHAREAIEFLGTWLSDAQPGGLLAELRTRGWLETFTFRPLYQFAGQALLHAEFKLSAAGLEAREKVSDMFFDWLRFFRAADWQGLLAEYALLQQRRASVGSALELARHDCEHYAGQASFPSAALDQLLDSLQPAQHTSVTAPWQLPPPNPFLRPTPVAPVNAQVSVALTYSPALPSVRDTGALYLQWQLESPLRDSLWRVLEQALQSLMESARQAGVDVSFSACAHYWQLKCFGAREPIAAIVEQALKALTLPIQEHWRDYAQPKAEQPLMPIRQLLKLLPEHCLGAYKQREEYPDPITAIEDLQYLWTNARWQGLATGFNADNRVQLQAALQSLPGQPGTFEPHVLSARRIWSQVPLTGNEHALLLFCPAPGHDLTAQATWRLLTHLCQGPFYQRLRVELQLGYAVFSAFRQLQGVSGVLFGVQSPQTTSRDILEHVRAFLDALPVRLAELDPAGLHAQRLALAAQFDESAMANADIAEWAWQSQLADSSTSLPALQQSILRVEPAMLREAAEQLSQAQHGWLALANGPRPDTGWQTTI
ncbi:pyrroloquinoline quinone biosynthesis protein PqqF [Pseudomonas akapageensis]|uniref:pyrroloquinoline quinone biosynthesis protein PqqF n=1 Tax=Pseudomonas akapageensis TaxID=2609961 RepID=UPI00140BBE46|nr:pyrroloquinoline quinone biosynthesis protein PqqF [Pseudomonas akapageensis]